MVNFPFDDEGDDSEAWISSFADMMCLLLGFFMILYSMSVMDEAKFADLGRQIAESIKGQPVEEADDTRQEIFDPNRSVRAFQMLVAILNLGQESDVAKKIEELYRKQVFEKEGRSLLEYEAQLDPDMIKNELEQDTLEKDLEIVYPLSNLIDTRSERVSLDGKRRIRGFLSALDRMTGYKYLEIEVKSASSRSISMPISLAERVADAFVEGGLDSRKLAVYARASSSEVSSFVVFRIKY